MGPDVEIEDLGTEEVGDLGISATHLHTEVGMDEWMGAATDQADPEALEDAVGGIEGLDPDAFEDLGAMFEDVFEGVELPVDLWVDDDGHVRRMVIEISYGDMFGGMADSGLMDGVDADEGDLDDALSMMGGASMRMTYDLVEVGGDVEIEAPDPADVVELDDDLLGLGS
jgi:hypothetical protein